MASFSKAIIGYPKLGLTKRSDFGFDKYEFGSSELGWVSDLGSRRLVSKTEPINVTMDDLFVHRRSHNVNL